MMKSHTHLLKSMMLYSCLLIASVILTGCSNIEGTQPITKISYVNNTAATTTGRKDSIDITTDTNDGLAAETVSLMTDSLSIDVDSETSEEYINYCGMYTIRPLSKSPTETNEAYRYIFDDYLFEQHDDYYVPDETYDMIKQVILSPRPDKAVEILALYP